MNNKIPRNVLYKFNEATGCKSWYKANDYIKTHAISLWMPKQWINEDTLDISFKLLHDILQTYKNPIVRGRN